MIYDVFISYSRRDMPVAEQVRSTLESAGLNCFTDRNNIPPGSDYVEYLRTAIRKSKVFLYIASKNAYDSDWSHYELNEFLEEKGFQELFVYQIDDGPLPDDLSLNGVFVFSRRPTGLINFSGGITDLELASRIISVTSQIHLEDDDAGADENTPSFFITHSHSDNGIAKEIYEFFTQNHIPCWLDLFDIPKGVQYAQAIMEGLHSCDTLLVLYSRNVVDSHDMLDEIQEAHTTNMRIIPFLLDETPLVGQFRYYLARRQWVVAHPDYMTAIQDLLISLHQESRKN